MTRDELIAAMLSTNDDKPRAVEIKGWGTLHVRDITVAKVPTDGDVATETLAKSLDMPLGNIRLARTAARKICDEKGALLFDADNEEDIKLLASRAWKRIS